MIDRQAQAQERPLISIIIPCYNYGKWVGEAIQSCLDQTYKNLEIVIVDDGSQDQTLEVIKNFHKINPSVIKYFTKSNEGVSSARNLGIKMSKGDYFIFLDADDMLLPDAVSSFIKTIQEQKKDAAVGDWINFREDSKSESYASSKFIFPGDPIASLIIKPMVASATMIKRNPQKWNESLKVNEVFEYFFGLLAKNYSFAHVDKTVTRIRQHLSPNRATFKYDHFNPQVRIDLFCVYKDTLKERGLLTFYREMAIDYNILSDLYTAKRRGIKNDKNYFDRMNIKNFRKYSWYKPFGLSGFVYRLPRKTGLDLFYVINKILGRA